QAHNLAQAARVAITAGSPPIWTRSFTILFTLVAALTIAGSVYALAISHGSLHFVTFVLSFILMFLATITGTSVGISQPMPRGILLFTGIAALISCFALQTDPAVQEATRVALHGITPSQFLAFGLVALAIVTLLRSIFKWKDWI